MEITDRSLYEYAVVRYVPRVDREEFINIGLVMMCKRLKWMRGAIHLHKDRILAFDSATNMKLLEKQSSLFTRTDVPDPQLPVEEKYRWLTAVKSATLQVSPSHPGLLGIDIEPTAESLNKEFERLMTQLVL